MHMNRFINSSWLAIFLVASSAPAFAQQTLSKEELKDYTARAKNQIKVFLDNVPEIAAGSKSQQYREAAARTTLKIFSSNAVIQEKNKFSKKTTKWKPADYLKTLTNRSEQAPVLIDFEVIDDLSPEKMKTVKNPDGSVSYIGKMVFRQYYCKLKEDGKLREPTQSDPDINCQYSDTTDKEVTFELRVQESVTGKFWVTKIAAIEVLRIF
jgi:hypothetical protein